MEDDAHERLGEEPSSFEVNHVDLAGFGDDHEIEQMDVRVVKQHPFVGKVDGRPERPRAFSFD